MRRTDYLGNPVSADDDLAVAAVDDFVGGFLGYEARAAGVVAAADAAADDPLLNAYAGILWMLLEAPEAPALARTYLEAAERASARANPRERMTAAFLRAWIEDDLPLALSVADETVEAFPHDLAMVKLRQYHDFNRGDFPAMLRVALKVLDANSHVPHMHGMTAFAYEQCHLIDEAEAAARTAVDMRRKEPWAHHALAHVMLTRGRIDEGARFLEEVSETWTGLNSFMESHAWWHLALFYLSQGRDAEALALYDERCWGIAKSYSQDQIGAVSLLARLELAGVDVGGRWGELAGWLKARANDTVQPFLSLQYFYGLARAGAAEADQLLGAIAERARAAPAFAREAWSGVALPAAEGLAAHVRRDWDEAVRRLGAALPRMVEIGGSHAQRDLFEQLHLDAAIRAGRLVSAQQTLEIRRGFDPDGVHLNRALADVYVRLDLPAQAAQAAARAEKTLARRR